MSERKEVVIRAQVTEAQALALELMLETWNTFGSWGSSRFVAFYADGDGNFHPQARIEKPPEFRPLTDGMRKAALVAKRVTVHGKERDVGQEIHFIDFDPIAWMLPKG